MIKKLFIISLLLFTIFTVKASDDLDVVKVWFKGNGHAHDNWGPPQLQWTDPDVVIRWYREKQYNFVSLTDLNFGTPVEGLKAVHDALGRFLIVAGTELSAEPLGVGVKIIDTLGIGIDLDELEISPKSNEVGGGSSTYEVLKSQIEDIVNAGGLPIIAHPYLTYALNSTDFINLCEDYDLLFFEILNGEPGMNFYGGGGFPSVEELWDQVLSAECVMYAVATDDSHHFKEDTLIKSSRPDEPVANPGQGWIWVRSEKLEWEDLAESMEEGDFYATNGIKVIDYHADNTGVSLVLDETTSDLGWSLNTGSNPTLYRTYFIGKHGTVLKLDESSTPSYEFQPGDLYVRAKVVSSDGHSAWFQPVFQYH